MNISIRDAKAADAEFIAWIVCEAVGAVEVMPWMAPVCSDGDALYSWRHTRLVEVDGVVAGGLISYDGGLYMPLRQQTWPVFWAFDNRDELASIEPECSAGEYYLDSMAVLPEYRGAEFSFKSGKLKLGKALLLDGLDLARGRGFTAASLIVESLRPGLIRYYESVGAIVCGDMQFFGHRYLKMKVPL